MGQLVRLQHKQCRFLHMPTTAAIGIVDDVIALSNHVGLYRLFTAEYLAYKWLTLEFLSMVEVVREHVSPRRLTFQLRNKPRSLTVDELNALVNMPEQGYYVGDHIFDHNEIWKKICHIPVERCQWFNPMIAKATSICNTVFRYFHRLIISTLLSRLDVGTCLANDMHIMVAATHHVSQHAGCYLVDHFEKQSNLVGGSKIAIGAMITPIAMQFRVPLPDEPISRYIHLDRAALKQQWMLAKDANLNHWYWKIYGWQCDYIFPLPNTPLTSIMGNDPGIGSRWNLTFPEHWGLMWRVGEARFEAKGRGGDDDEERREEEAAYEEGGDGEHHHEHVQPQMGNQEPYALYRQFAEDQVGGVHQEVVDLRREAADVRTFVGTSVDRVYDAQREWFELQQLWQEQQRIAQEQRRVQEENYFRMVQEMHRS